MEYLNVNVVNGLYDLCDSFSFILIPQKSLSSISAMLDVPKTSLLYTMAGKSSWTKSPDSELI